MKMSLKYCVYVYCLWITCSENTEKVGKGGAGNFGCQAFFFKLIFLITFVPLIQIQNI